MNDIIKDHSHPEILMARIKVLQADLSASREWARGVLTGRSASDNFTEQQKDGLQELITHLVSASPEQLMKTVSAMNAAFRDARDTHSAPPPAANDELAPSIGYQRAARHEACM